MAGYEKIIIDSSKPNTGKVYNYISDKDQNFEINRQAVKALKKLLPDLENFTRNWYFAARNLKT